MGGKMDCYGISDPGKIREMNEDQFLIAELQKSMLVHQTSLGIDRQTRLFGDSQGKLLIVADGLGGHAAGERASQIVVDSLTSFVLNHMHWLNRPNKDRDQMVVDDLQSALKHCQSVLRAEALAVPEQHNMASTLTIAYILWPRLFVVHVGDCRCYVFRQSQLRQITTDHTVAQQLVEDRKLDRADLESSHWNNVLWNVIGGSAQAMSPEIFREELRLGDTLLLCTDGLTKHVTDPEITACLARGGSARETCEGLVGAANTGGGTDNVTVVLASFQSTGEPAGDDVGAVHDVPRQSNPFTDTVIHIASSELRAALDSAKRPDEE